MFEKLKFRGLLEISGVKNCFLNFREKLFLAYRQRPKQQKKNIYRQQHQGRRKKKYDREGKNSKQLLTNTYFSVSEDSASFSLLRKNPI